MILHFVGYDRLFGSHYDEYVVEYTTFTSSTPDPSVFDYQESELIVLPQLFMMSLFFVLHICLVNTFIGVHLHLTLVTYRDISYGAYNFMSPMKNCFCQFHVPSTPTRVDMMVCTGLMNACATRLSTSCQTCLSRLQQWCVINVYSNGERLSARQLILQYVTLVVGLPLYVYFIEYACT